MARAKAKERDDHQTEVLKAFRHLLGGITTEDFGFVEQLTGDERRDFMKFCHETANNPFFKRMISHLFYPQIMFSVQQAENYEEVTFGRATCNGIMLVQEMFTNYANEYQEKYLNEKEEFDPSKSFEPVENS